MLIAKFAYNNIKNVSIGYIPLVFNYLYHLKVFVKDEINLYSKSCFDNKLVDKLKKLIEICY